MMIKIPMRGSVFVAFGVINEDLRTIKTKKALYAAMYTLLKSFNFKKITIKEICEEALISRATFYLHFIDKYDLIKQWLPKFWPSDFNIDNSYEQMEKIINCHIQENIIIYKNILYEIDEETLAILFDFILSVTTFIPKKSNENELYIENVVLSNIFAGGILSYLTWQVKNKFPSEVPLMNKHLFKVIQTFQNWQEN